MIAESVMRRYVNVLDRFTEYSGRLLAWLTLGMGLLTGLIVLLRYGFGIGSIAAQEAVMYMHGSLFLLGASYALKVGAHVRVDIFYRNFSARTRSWIDSLGGIIFLLPLCACSSSSAALDYVSASWAVRETSAEPGGIPAVYSSLKSLLPLMAINLALQAVAEVLRNALVLVQGVGQSSGISSPSTYFLAVCLFLMLGIPGRLHARGDGTGLRHRGSAHWQAFSTQASSSALPARIFGTVNNSTLIAVPLFILMGTILEKSRVAEELLDSMARLLGSCARRPRCFRGRRRNVSRGQHRYCRRYRRDDGASLAAEHVA